jgi:hypothetical protein
MHSPRTRSDAALELWDYFYLTKGPASGDEQPWGKIERATCRIRASEPDLDAPTLALRSARRIRDAARIALRQIERLSVAPERWTIDRLAEFEALASQMLSGVDPRVQRPAR